MTKVMVFNFKTMQFEQASEEEGNELLSLIGSMNADCAAQQNAHLTATPTCPHISENIDGSCPYCNLPKPPQVA